MQETESPLSAAFVALESQTATPNSSGSIEKKGNKCTWDAEKF
jgi:hypothetical protein